MAPTSPADANLTDARPRSGGPLANNVHQMAATKLAAVGQRYTVNRRAVVEALLGLPGPATIAEVLQANDTLAQSSTYRNLVVLEEVRVVHRIVTSDDHARYELTEEITGQHHHHLICERCGVIIDVTLDPTVEVALERALAAGAVANGFRGVHHRVDLLGVCASCDAAEREADGSEAGTRSPERL